MYFSTYHFAINPTDYFSSYYFSSSGSGGIGHHFFNDYFRRDYFIGSYFLYSGATVASAYDVAYRMPDMWWIPRWMEPNYDTTSIFRKFYHLGLNLPRRNINESLIDTGRLDFFTSRCQDRIAYTVPISFKQDKIPVIRLVSPYSETVQPNTVVSFKSIEDFLFEREYPVATLLDGQLLLKNLAVATQVTPTVSSYYINLNQLDSVYDIHPDATIVTTDGYGDKVTYSQDSTLIQNGYLYTGLEAYYVVSYLSSALHSKVIAGNIYITIDGTRYNVKPYYLDNLWDSALKLHSLKRSTETNFNTKTKVQALAFAENATTRIGASLGLGGISFWDMAASSFTFPLSGVTACDLRDIDYHGYKMEFPVRDGSSYLLSVAPAPPYTVVYNGKVLDPSSYCISGYTLTTTVSGPVTDAVNNMIVFYKRTFVTKSYSVDGKLESLSTNKDLGLISVAYTTGVSLNTSTKTFKKWHWDKVTDARNGTADFE